MLWLFLALKSRNQQQIDDRPFCHGYYSNSLRTIFIFLLNKDVEGCKWCFTNSDSGRDVSINGFLFDDAQERRHEKKEAVALLFLKIEIL